MDQIEKMSSPSPTACWAWSGPKHFSSNDPFLSDPDIPIQIHICSLSYVFSISCRAHTVQVVCCVRGCTTRNDVDVDAMNGQSS